MLSEPTSSHAAIQFWARMHGAHPAERLPEIVDSIQPVLCFIFHRSAKESERVIPISWEVFFERFDLLDLAFMGEMDEGAVPVGYEMLYARKNPPEPSLLT